MSDGTAAALAGALVWLTGMVIWLSFCVGRLRSRLDEHEGR